MSLSARTNLATLPLRYQGIGTASRVINRRTLLTCVSTTAFNADILSTRSGARLQFEAHISAHRAERAAWWQGEEAERKRISRERGLAALGCCSGSSHTPVMPRTQPRPRAKGTPEAGSPSVTASSGRAKETGKRLSILKPLYAAQQDMC
ncbi:hypothetical protein ROHU_026331 [Labeo rohita]|uniref:Uncharacterized protein n=1 Tax=Labeo rohita TaxID=84645 RepID=A0A498MMF0_LABRO|nr:hypothetical protein ROHU_026331 [Labeo rohita]